MTNVPNVNPISDKVKGKQKLRATQGKSRVHFPCGTVDTWSVYMFHFSSRLV